MYAVHIRRTGIRRTCIIVQTFIAHVRRTCALLQTCWKQRACAACRLQRTSTPYMYTDCVHVRRTCIIV